MLIRMSSVGGELTALHALPWKPYLHEHTWRVRLYYDNPDVTDGRKLRDTLQDVLSAMSGPTLHNVLGDKATNEGIAEYLLAVFPEAAIVEVWREAEQLGAVAHR